MSNIKVTVDSWNNVPKYVNVIGAFFIFDEQRLVGSGAWVKSFYQIAKKNKWILLTATPGDNWIDYIPVFVANGFYKNKTQFIREHVVYNPYITKFPKIEKYVNVQKLMACRDMITIYMDYHTPNVRHEIIQNVGYDENLYRSTVKNYWNPYLNEPIREISAMCYILRRITNSDPSRIEMLKRDIKMYPRLIVFYNFDYELEILRNVCKELDVQFAEWNGHKHMPIPNTKTWVYLVQYNSGAEGWNCIDTNTMLFYSGNPSYKIMEQAAGRIDRVNTPYKDLYYIHLKSNSPRDNAIYTALKNKTEFNEQRSVKEELAKMNSQELQGML